MKRILLILQGEHHCILDLLIKHVSLMSKFTNNKFSTEFEKRQVGKVFFRK